MKELVEKLIKEKKTIATMESCTGGAMVNEITNIEGSSEILKFSAVTYSNDYKISLGVSKKIIDKYSVYSKETARAMAYNISKYASSDIGIGITGKMNRSDLNNQMGNDDEIFVSIYYENKYYDLLIKAIKSTRKLNKELVVDTVCSKLKEILKTNF